MDIRFSIKTLNYIRAPNPGLSSGETEVCRKGKFLPFAFLSIPAKLASREIFPAHARRTFGIYCCWTSLEGLGASLAAKRSVAKFYGRQYDGDVASRRVRFLASPKMSVAGAAVFVAIVNNGRTAQGTTMYKRHSYAYYESSEARKNIYV